MRKEFDELLNIEDEFFILDKESKLAIMKLEFDSPKDIFDSNAITKIPILNDDFIDWISASFEYAPNNYKISLDISFKEMNGYNSQELHDIFIKNLTLEAKKGFKKTRRKNSLAYSLMVIGLIFLIGLILINTLWKDDNVFKTILIYISDIATTVTFWEALIILIVENKEKTNHIRNLIKRYSSIDFHKSE